MNSILVSLLNNLGDVIMSVSALRMIRDNFPGVRIAVLVRPETADVLINNPVVDEVLVYRYRSKSFFRGMRDIVSQVRNGKFDVYLSLDRRARSGLVAFLAGIKNRIGPSLLFYGSKPKPWTKLLFNKIIPMPMEDRISTGESFRIIVRRAFGFAGTGAISLPPLPAECVERAHGVLEHASRPRIGFCVRAPFELKNWPAERFARLMDRLKRELGAFMYVTGAPGDREYVAGLLAKCPDAGALNLAGRTSILDVAALAAESELFITLDTGGLHVVANSGLKKIIAIFCCTSPIVVKDSLPDVVFMWSGEECNPCQDVRPDECSNRKCMDNITVDMVYEKAVQLLESEDSLRKA